jgi:transcriptional regulator with XRE-family HTH domain
MPKRANLPAEQSKRGRGQPTKYQPDYVKIAQLMAERGATQDEIADGLNVTRRTVANWLARHDEFSRAVNAGNEVFNPRVERALAERAIGFYADKYVWRKTTEKERRKDKELPEWVLEPSERVYYPPDTTAGIYWSKNRMKDKWANVHKVEGSTKFKSSDEILDEIAKQLLRLRDEGYDLTLPALPSRKDGSDA